MKRGLELFVEALEQCRKERYISKVSILPMQKPAYKEVTIEVYKMHGANKELYATASNVYMITTTGEREDAIDDLTKYIIGLVLNKKA